VDPVDQLDVGVPPHLAENGGGFDTAVSQAVELAKQGDATDLSHKVLRR
jgi:hypothetical protein